MMAGLAALLALGTIATMFGFRAAARERAVRSKSLDP